MREYDIAIIGSGAGLTILDAALESGMKCALIEHSKFGGTCLTRGCIPSKILVYPADAIREAEHVKKIGLDFKPPKISWDAISDRMWGYIDESTGIENSLSSVPNLSVYKGTGEFTGPYSMKVKMKDDGYSEEFKAKRFVIAAGGRSNIPGIEGLDETGFVTSESFFDTAFPQKPWRSLLIIGGGAVGAEFAHIFSAFGTKVTVVDIQPRLLVSEEEEISVQLEKQFKNNGIDVVTNHKVISVQKNGENKVARVENIISGKIRTIECEEILISSGLRSNADMLKVEKTGVETDARGWIVTNEYLQTSQKNVWALGDINGKYQFRHKANYEADICINNIFKPENGLQAADYTKVPWAIFTFPQIAHVGITEKEALNRGLRILVGRNHYSSVAKGFAMGYSKGDEDDGFVKLIAGENKKILGVHIVGPHASILIQPFVYLMNAGFTCAAKHVNGGKKSHIPKKVRIETGTIEPIFQSMVIHPSLSELTGWVIDNLEWVN